MQRAAQSRAACWPLAFAAPQVASLIHPFIGAAAAAAIVMEAITM
jgi:hypothetical protein